MRCILGGAALSLCVVCHAQTPEAAPATMPVRLQRLQYNNPGLVVDLGVGLWGTALPMDYDGDGQADLLMGWGGRPSNGIMLFEPADGATEPFVYRPGKLVSKYVTDVQTSFTNNRWFVVSPGKHYPNFREQGQNGFQKISFEPSFHTPKKFNLWRYYDMDGDGVQDLLISAYDGRDYGWDGAFDSDGRWTNGRQRSPLFWAKNTGTVAKPAFSEAQPIMAGDKPAEVFGLPGPNFADFNGDGLGDLISCDGLDFLAFFKNIGTLTAPRFAQGQPLTRDGKIIRMHLEMLTPAAMDIDRDGDMDLVIGEEDGRAELLRNTGNTTDDGMPIFELPMFLRQQAVDLKSGALTTPFGFDLDGDGDMDLVTGNTAGYIAWFENLGGQPPKWAAPEYLKANGEVIRIQAGENGSIQGPAEAKWGYTSVSVADWNNDLLPDLIVNSIWGKVVWYQNIGSRNAAKFAGARPVGVQWSGSPRKPEWNWWHPQGDELVVQWRSSVHALDLTRDGLVDLVAMDEDGYLAVFERARDGGKLLPGRRVFHVEPGAPNVFDFIHAPMQSDENNDGQNDQAGLDAAGRLGFHHRIPGTTGTSVKWVSRSGDPRYTDPDNATALRLNSGWAGRSGRCKFVLCDWDQDGRMDVLITSFNANFLRNISDDPRKFVLRDMGPVDGLRLAGHDTCPAAVDFDNTGVPDLVLGAEDGFFYYLRNPHPIVMK